MELKINKQELFPTLIYHIPNFISLEQCEIIFNFLKNKPIWLDKHNLIPNDNSSKSSHSKQLNILNEIIELDKCKNILKDLSYLIKSYEKETGFLLSNNTLESWFNIQNKGSVLKQHCHSNCVLSGALYINVPRHSAPLCFTNPNYRLQMYRLKDTKFSIIEMQSTPQNG
jgi:hypothetical protein